jgi:outer membrane lipoprotein-sorting protein
LIAGGAVKRVFCPRLQYHESVKTLQKSIVIQKENPVMRYYLSLALGGKPPFTNLLTMMSLFLSMVAALNASALTAQTVMDNVLTVYEDVENYAAVVHTYKADSMQASESLFERQPPRVAFNLFFRKPNQHAVQEIGNSRRGIFRIELLSTLGHLKRLEIRLQGRESLLGQRCHVLEVTDPNKPGDKAQLWIAPRDWRVLQLTLFIKSVELARTQFKYPDRKRGSQLPIETRSFFPISKQVLINHIADYRVNIGLPSEIFDDPKAGGTSN